MIQVLSDWVKRYLSDPQAVFLAILLFVGFSIVIFMGQMLLPVFASIVIAYLLDRWVDFMQRRGSKRMLAVILVFMIFLALLIMVLFGLVPLLAKQVAEFFQQLPTMITRGQKSILELPEIYSFISPEQVKELMAAIGNEIGAVSQRVLSYSLSSLTSLITLVVYLILMPLLVFFFLKDKYKILAWFGSFLPTQRSLMGQVWHEMDGQLGNYVRGKFWEILIIGIASSVTFAAMGLPYAILLGALVGLSVIVPYVGAVAVTFPVVLVAYFQWGWSAPFAYLVAAYAIIQTIDAMILVPLLFSEVVNLHPIAIIVAVLVFGGIWGFWGVFFAIPLATLVQALLRAWPRNQHKVSGEIDTT